MEIFSSSYITIPPIFVVPNHDIGPYQPIFLKIRGRFIVPDYYLLAAPIKCCIGPSVSFCVTLRLASLLSDANSHLSKISAERNYRTAKKAKGVLKNPVFYLITMAYVPVVGSDNSANSLSIRASKASTSIPFLRGISIVTLRLVTVAFAPPNSPSARD